MSYEYCIGKIKKGDILCEFDGYCFALRVQAIEDGYEENGDYKVKMQKIGSDEIICYSVDKKYLHYGPELYFGDYSVPYLKVEYLNGEKNKRDFIKISF